MRKLGIKIIKHESLMVKGVICGSTTILHTISDNGMIIYSSTSFEDACSKL